MQIRKFITATLFLFILMLAAMPAAAKVYTVKDVPNVHLSDSTAYVSDPDGVLRKETLAKVNRTLDMLEDSTTVETAIVIVDDIGQADIYDFALALGRHWGVGKKDVNNGVVVVFALAQRQVRIQTGSGTEGVLPDIAAKRLIEEKVIPCMKTGDIDNAVIDLSDGLYKVFTDPTSAAELKGEKKDNIAKDLGKIFLFFCCLMALLSMSLLVYYVWQMRHYNTYQKALHCRENRWVFILLAILSCGLGLPFMIMYLLLGHYYRNHKRNCDVCGTQMKKLSEKEDNNYLTEEQDKEEQLKSVDYDVWLCPKCGTTEIFPFVSKFSKYKMCPRCKARTLELLYDRVERKPTHISDGVGVKVYQCKNCGKRTEERYTIPKQQAAVFIAGGGGGRGGSGGGFSGGSWGGGGFSGGGASGSW